MKPIVGLIIAIAVVTAVYWDEPRTKVVYADDIDAAIPDARDWQDVYDELLALQTEVGQLRRRIEKLEAK